MVTKMDSIYIYIQQGGRDYLFQLSQWEQSPPNPYYLFIYYLFSYLFCLTILLLLLLLLMLLFIYLISYLLIVVIA